MEGLKKAGEAILAFANIVTALVFFKSFWLTSDQSDLLSGVALINYAQDNE